MGFFTFLDRNIVPLVVGGLLALFLWGIGYLIVSENAERQARVLACINAGQMYVEGNCLPRATPVAIPAK